MQKISSYMHNVYTSNLLISFVHKIIAQVRTTFLKDSMFWDFRASVKLLLVNTWFVLAVLTPTAFSEKNKNCHFEL